MVRRTTRRAEGSGPPALRTCIHISNKKVTDLPPAKVWGSFGNANVAVVAIVGNLNRDRVDDMSCVL
jgi:hypothetical protein